jgi:hypothetical protein
LTCSRTWRCGSANRVKSANGISVLKIDKPEDVKGGDFKGVIRFALSKTMADGRARDALEALIVSSWDYTQTLLHKNTTSRAEALRTYLWTEMVISEIFEQTKAC